MINIIVVFPKIENAKRIKSILIKSGFLVHAVCTTGAKALQYADMLEDGIVICAGRMQDMMYTQLREYLPLSFQMLVLDSPNLWEEEKRGDIICLSMPLKVHELTSTLEMMCHSQLRARKKQKSMSQRRSKEEEQLVRRAKEILMERNHMTEKEAHRYLQKSSMDSGTSLTEAAQMILCMLDG